MRKNIVSLILEENGKILVEKRKGNKSTSPNAIVCPAGHVEEGETNEEALFREMLEELGIEVYGLKLIHQANLDCEEEQRIFWYTCKGYYGKIQNNEAEKLLWISHSESNLLTHEVSKEVFEIYFRNK